MSGSGSRSFATLWALAVALFAGGVLSAQTFSLPATADTFIRQNSANQNQGQLTTLSIQDSGNYRALVRMDPAAIASAVGSGHLASATLELYATSSGGWGSSGKAVDVQRMTASWTENGATWNCADDTTPTNSQPNCATQWAGGTFDDEASDSVTHLNTTAGPVQWNVTDDVRAFLAGTPNYGWLAKLSDETAGGNADYSSRQGAHAPRLILVVESPTFDQVPPTIAITTPAHPFVINDTTPALSVSYADGGSGVALGTLDVRVDGTATVCTAGASSATCEPATLGQGAHSVTASIRDQAGNQATADPRAFTLLIGPGLRTATFPATSDTTLKKSSANQNYGTDPTLRLRQSGKNRSLVRFDAAEIARTIGQGTLRSASLELQVGNSSGWGKTGRTVDVHRLTADWTEAGSTWNCGIDTIPSNGAPNCATQWAGGAYAATPTATVLHTNGQTGTVAFDVSADLPAVVAGNPSYGWLVKKSDETKSGKADYASRETGASGAPRLVVLFEVPDGGGDTKPPTIAITAPTAAVIYNDTTPQIRVEYSDVGSGVNLASLHVSVDGSPLSGCQAGAAFATCEATELFDGEHYIAAEVSDSAGNHSAATRQVETRSDGEAPMLGISRPVGTLYNNSSPVVQVDFTELDSAIDTASFVLLLDGTNVGSNCSVDRSHATCQLAGVAPGSHAIHVVVRDLAGNEGTNDREFVEIDDHASPHLAIVAPTAAGLFFSEAAQATVEFSDAGSGIAGSTLNVVLDGVEVANCAAGSSSGSCPLPSLSEGGHTLAATIEDRAGNVAHANLAFAVAPERQPPLLSILSPLEPIVLGSRLPAIELAYSDGGSGIDPASLVVRIDELDISNSCQAGAAGAICSSPALSPGVHTLAAEIADLRGNRARTSRDVEISVALAVAITSPAGGTIVREPTVRLEGTVSPGATSVQVGGVPASISSGTWVAPAVPIREGGNTLTVVARSEAGGIGTATVAIIRDSEAPRVAILTPHDGFITSASQIVVSGDLVDSVSTSSTQHALKVLINDHEAMVERKSFVLTDLLLVPGENRIEVTAEDEAGNVGRSAITVRFVPDAVARIEEISGNFQAAAIRDTLEQPLVVRIVDFLGRPLPGRTVDFAVTRGDGALLSFPDSARKLSAVTNEEGLAAMRFALGTRAGAGNQEVTVSSVGIPGSVLFCASARPKAAKQVQPIAATDFQGAKIGPTGQPLPKPLFVQVFDGFGNPVAGQEVIFRSVAGGGTFAGASETRVTTDDEGKAGAVFTLGPDEGINNNRVEVTFEGDQDEPARFVISGLTPGPAELTAMSGIVLDPSDAPVPGARIHIGSNETRTDVEGRFRLNGVPVGTVHVEIDGSTVTRPGTWPPLGYEMVMISGRVNELGKPMRLPQIDDAGKKRVGGDQDVTIPIHGVAGAMLTVFAHSVTFPDGSHEGDVAFTQVPAQKVPMVAPQNAGFMLAWTIQPAGVRFDPPARVSIPNFGVPGGGGNPPGLTGEIYSFDHDLGEFVSAGTASITEDGMMMMSNPGMGISKAGWGGCPHPPAPPAQGCGHGTCTACPREGGPPASNCGTCHECQGEDGCQPRKVSSFEIGTKGDEEEPALGERNDRERAGQASPADSPKIFGVGQTVIFAPDTTKANCQGPTQLTWNFDDGTTSEEIAPRHAFKEAKTYHVTAKMKCATCPDPGYLADEIVKVVDLIEGHFKVVATESKLDVRKEDEDNDQKPDLFFRSLGGFRIKLSLMQEPLIGDVNKYKWSAPSGHFFDGYGPAANALTGAQLEGPNLREIYWESDPMIGQDVAVQAQLFRLEKASVKLRRRIKTRMLQLASPMLDGDDVKMLTNLLRQLGFSATPKVYPLYGVAGAPVPVTSTFDPVTEAVVKFVQDIDGLPTPGQVGNLTLGKYQLHWKDYVAAVDDPQFASASITASDPNFETWLDGAVTELQVAYPEALHISWSPVSYKDFMRSWITQETGRYGHWGANGFAHRITLGTADPLGSIGFSQVLNDYKYGGNIVLSGPAPNLPNLNLYKPDESIKAFGTYSAHSRLGAGFYRSFQGSHPNDVTSNWSAEVFPRIGNVGQASQAVTYPDSTKDLFMKGIYSYNGGSGDVELRTQSWPEMRASSS